MSILAAAGFRESRTVNYNRVRSAVLLHELQWQMHMMGQIAF